MRPATPGVGRRPRQHAGFVTCHSVPPPQIIQKPAESKMGMLKAMLRASNLVETHTEARIALSTVDVVDSKGQQLCDWNEFVRRTTNGFARFKLQVFDSSSNVVEGVSEKVCGSWPNPEPSQISSHL